MRPPAFRAFGRLRDLLAARGGIVAIETAIVAPFLLVAVLLLVDTVRYIRTTARMDRVAALTADLVARSDTVVDRVDFTAPALNNELGMFFLAANISARPDDLAGDGRVIVTSFTPVAGGIDTHWTRSGPYGLAEPTRLDGLDRLPRSGVYVAAEVFFRFRSAILENTGLLSAAAAIIYRRAVFRPRTGALEQLDEAP